MSEVDAKIVWGCAAAAHRVNCGYIKQGYYVDVKDEFGNLEYVEANKTLVRSWMNYHANSELSRKVVTPDDIKTGESIREYWQSKMLVLLNDDANSYIQSVVKLAHEDKIAFNDSLAINTIASSISSALREMEREAIDERKQAAIPHSRNSVGQRVQYDTGIEVIGSRYVQSVGVYMVEMIVENYIYSFWFKKEIKPGRYSMVKGRVKAIKDDFNVPSHKNTQLNYVNLGEMIANNEEVVDEMD